MRRGLPQRCAASGLAPTLAMNAARARARARSVGACPNAADSPEEVGCYPPPEDYGLYEPKRPTLGAAIGLRGRP
eukprot:6756245-Lingulodinium_polyedra.AAC.1